MTIYRVGRGIRIASITIVACIIAAFIAIFSASSASAETPQERCERETKAYNQRMQDTLPPGVWYPPYVCAGAQQPGGSTGEKESEAPTEEASAPEVEEAPSEPEFEGPRTGLDERMAEREANRAGRENNDPLASTNMSTEQSDGGLSGLLKQPGTNPTVERAAPREDHNNLGANAYGETSTRDDEAIVERTTNGISGSRGNQRSDDSEISDDIGVGSGMRESINNPSNPDPASYQAALEDFSKEEVTAASEDSSSSKSIIQRLLGAIGALIGGICAWISHRDRRNTSVRMSELGEGTIGRLMSDFGNGSYEYTIHYPDGREQTIILMEGSGAPREYRFDMDVPEGGCLIEGSDGSVDVLDAEGNVVEHVKPPWAYDVLGRPVLTDYEVDNETGELVQYVDPDHTTYLPIIADPISDPLYTPEQQADIDAMDDYEPPNWDEEPLISDPLFTPEQQADIDAMGDINVDYEAPPFLASPNQPNLVERFSPTQTDLGMNTATVGADYLFSKAAAVSIEEMEKAAGIGKVIDLVPEQLIAKLFGRLLGVAGMVANGYLETKSGMDPVKAYVTNIAGPVLAMIGVALLLPGAGVVATVGSIAVAGFVLTKGFQWIWDTVTSS